MLRALPASTRLFPKWRLAAIFLLMATVLGFVLGACEGAFLLIVQNPAHFKEHLVGTAILGLAPLVDAVAFGVIGGVLGLAAEFCHRNHPRCLSLLAFLGLSMAGAYATFVPARVLIGGVGHRQLIEFACSLLGGLSVAIAAKLTWRFLQPPPTRVTPPFGLHWRMLVRDSVVIVAIVLVAISLAIFRRVATAAAPRSQDHAGGVRSKRPNVVMIALDTVRADHLSSYGYSRPTTPNLDRLAKKGVLFETAVAPSSWTLPSFASVFTGLLPHQHSADENVALPKGMSVLASILGSRGYQTAGFNANYVMGTKRTGLAQGFDLYDDDDRSLRTDLGNIDSFKAFWWFFYYPFIHPDYIGRRDARELNRSIFSWFRQRSQQPFFLFVNYYDVHEPYSSIPEVGKEFGDADRPLPERIRAEVEDSALGIIEDPPSAKGRAELLAGYDSALNFTDSQIGLLLRLLETSAEWSNTYVIVFSDHGQSLGEQGHYGHGWGLKWELLHVPLIIAGPGIPEGRRISDPVGLQQLFATTLDLSEAAGRPAPGGDGLRCYWTQPANTCNPAPLVVSELGGVTNGPESLDDPLISVVTPEWHFLRDYFGEVGLYRLPSDCREEVNLAASPKYHDEIEALEHRLFERLQASWRPWIREQYLWAMGEQQSSLLTGKPTAKRGLPASKHRPPSEQDEELLRSLPYE